ncbi:MAG: hypothetical protein IPJ88_10225 [Myxococcales bacterium]|nr:MAG: hypothetical protein IPJ88_10225 [Myxococcales bacterium]
MSQTTRSVKIGSFPGITLLLAITWFAFAILSPTATAKDLGPFPANTIRDVASKHQGKMTACFMLGSNGYRDGIYQVKVVFSIDQKGRVRDAKVKKPMQVFLRLNGVS